VAFATAAAILPALFLARTLEAAGFSLGMLLILAGVAVAVFITAVNLLARRWVLKPLSDVAATAESIADGRTDLRVPERGLEEIASVGRAFNRLTDRMLQDRTRLEENVRSLDETNVRLNEAQRDLVQSEKMASLGHLAAGVAHEIGNPLGALLGYVSLQKRRGGDAEILEGMEREARRIDRILRELLDYARPGTALREPLDVNASIDRVVALLRGQGWLTGIEVRLELETALPPVLGDGHRLDQVFVNLLRNAESAMAGAGSIVIRSRLDRYQTSRPVPVRRADDPPGVNYSHLRRALDRRGGPEMAPGSEVVRVTVSDSGPGIPEDRLGQIFDPFFTTKAPGEGIGLGLAIVAGAIADLGGRVDVGSGPQGGAAFDLWIPTHGRET